MTGFAALAGLYVAAWAVLLAPAAYVLLGRPRRARIPDDRPGERLHVRAIAGRMQRAAVPAETVPLAEQPRRRRRRAPVASDEVVRVAGPVEIPASSVVTAGLVVDGDLTVGHEARLLSAVIATGGVRLGEGSASAGPVWADGPVVVRDGAHVDGPVVSRRVIVLHPQARVASALAPVVRGAPLDADAEPRARRRSTRPPEWTPDLDDELDRLWPEQQIDRMVEAFVAATGVEVRGSHLMERARALGLTARGIPPRPRFLGRRPAWVLTDEVVRVGADLRIRPGERISYSLVVEGALEVFHDAEMELPVRSGRGLLLHPGSSVECAAVSDGLIVCQEGSAVWGPADSSSHIVLFANARIGTRASGGASALGAIGLEPGAVIVGGAVAGLGVRGEPLRPDELRRRARERPEPTVVRSRPPRRRRRFVRRTSGSSASSAKSRRPGSSGRRRRGARRSADGTASGAR